MGTEDVKGSSAYYFFLFFRGAYYFYCAYVLRISRYSGFLSVMLTNTGIFLRGLKSYAEKQNLSKCSWYSKRKSGVTMHFSETIKLHQKHKTNSGYKHNDKTHFTFDLTFRIIQHTLRRCIKFILSTVRK